MSDGDAVPTSSRMRRRLFGRSHDSGGSSRRQSKDMSSPMASPTALPDHNKEKDNKDKESVSSGRHGKGKRSLDTGKGGGGGGGERLSIFGGTFGGSLNKGRKPPPR